MNNKKGERIATKTKKIALTGLLAALALALSFLESLMPAIAFLPPGAKIGLANIVVMLAMSLLGLPYAAGIAIIKCGFTGFLRGMSAFFISVTGAILSLLMLFLLTRFAKDRAGALGVSVMSATAYNTGQLAAASVMAGSAVFMAYAPIMLIAAIAAGVITGIAYWMIYPIAKKHIN